MGGGEGKSQHWEEKDLKVGRTYKVDKIYFNDFLDLPSFTSVILYPLNLAENKAYAWMNKPLIP